MRKNLYILIFCVLLSLLLSSCDEGAEPVGAETTAAITETESQSTEAPHETNAPETTDVIYSLSVDPTQYEAIPEDDYGLSENPNGSPCAFTQSGELKTATGTSLNVIILWNAVRGEGNNFATLTLEVAIEHKGISSKGFPGKLTFAGKETSFISPKLQYHGNISTQEYILTQSTSVECGYGETVFVDVNLIWDFIGRYENKEINKISLNGKIPIGEKYSNLKQKVSYEVNITEQNPALPEGCEVTSLSNLLNYLGFDVKHTYLSDNFLPKGTPGVVSPYEYNVGNPRNKGKSWGCYAPVIQRTANDYLATKESYLRAFDYTGFDISEIYYQLSLGHPAVVWVTMDYADTYVKQPWTINGEKFYWIYPLHCVLLVGYDLEAGTVTVADPMKPTPDVIDMEVFENSYRQMGSQAVIIKNSREKLSAGPHAPLMSEK